MNQMQHQVEQFHHATGQADGLDTPEKRLLRAKLIMEEAVETAAALGFWAYANIQSQAPDLSVNIDFEREYDEFHPIDFIDGLCDLMYVTMGGAVNIARDIQPHFNEVHRANMAKLTGPKREDGKQLKPEGWQPPDHQRILREYPSAPTDPLEDPLGEERWTAHVREDPLVSPTTTPKPPIMDSLWDAATTVTSASPPPDRG